MKFIADLGISPDSSPAKPRISGSTPSDSGPAQVKDIEVLEKARKEGSMPDQSVATDGGTRPA